LVLRDRVSSQSSSSLTCQPFDERLYVLHDFFNVTAVVNTGGTVLERYGYDAYGTVRFMDGSFNSRSSSSYGWETLYGDYRWDSETGLYQVRNRYLHPKLGTWLNRDPIGENAGTNLYRFVDDNPITYIDPDGAIPVPCPSCQPPQPDPCGLKDPRSCETQKTDCIIRAGVICACICAFVVEVPPCIIACAIAYAVICEIQYRDCVKKRKIGNP